MDTWTLVEARLLDSVDFKVEFKLFDLQIMLTITVATVKKNYISCRNESPWYNSMPIIICSLCYPLFIETLFHLIALLR